MMRRWLNRHWPELPTTDRRRHDRSSRHDHRAGFFVSADNEQSHEGVLWRGVLASFFLDYPQIYADGGLSTVSFIRPWRHGFCGFALDRASDAFPKTANAPLQIFTRERINGFSLLNRK